MISPGKTKFDIGLALSISLSGIAVIFQLYFYNMLEFHRDELLYFSLGQHLDFGYASVPPFVGFLAFISEKMFGYTLFAAKFFPAIAGGCVAFLSALMAKELKGGIYAQALAIVALSGSILFLRSSSLFQPVIFDILFWTITLYLVIKYMNTEKAKYILLLGVAIGLGFLNKYNILFLVIALFAALPFTKYRKIFISKYFYLSLLIAFLIALPNVIWQIVNHFPVIRHMTELRDTQLVKMNAAGFLTDQLFMIIPATLIVIPGTIYLFFAKKMKEFRLPGFVAILVVILFLVLRGKSYYTAGIFPFIVAASAVSIEKIFKPRYLQILAIAVLIYLEWIFLPIGKPIFNPEKLVRYFDKIEAVSGDNSSRRFEDDTYHKLPQDYADMLGWNELTEVTTRAWQQVDDKHSCIIYCENYGQAGAIDIIGKKNGLPEPTSFSDAFRYWIPKSFQTEITSMIYINDELGQDIKDLFADIQKVGQIENPLAREHGTGVYLCRNPRHSFNAFWKERVKEVTAE